MIRHLTPAVARASAWLDERSARERLLLQVMAALGLIAVLWYAAIQPLASARETALERIARYESLQARLRQAPAGPPPSVTSPALPGGSLVDAARQAAVAQGLAADIQGDAGRITVTLAAARFDAALPFLQTLESAGVELADVRLQAADQPGLINLTLSASRP